MQIIDVHSILRENFITSFRDGGKSHNARSRTINTWPYAGPLMLAGALCIILSLLFLRRAEERKKRAALAELAELESRPSSFARELAENQ